MVQDIRHRDHVDRRKLDIHDIAVLNRGIGNSSARKRRSCRVSLKGQYSSLRRPQPHEVREDPVSAAEIEDGATRPDATLEVGNVSVPPAVDEEGSKRHGGVSVDGKQVAEAGLRPN